MVDPAFNKDILKTADLALPERQLEDIMSAYTGRPKTTSGSDRRGNVGWAETVMEEMNVTGELRVEDIRDWLRDQRGDNPKEQLKRGSVGSTAAQFKRQKITGTSLDEADPLSDDDKAPGSSTTHSKQPESSETPGPSHSKYSSVMGHDSDDEGGLGYKGVSNVNAFSPASQTSSTAFDTVRVRIKAVSSVYDRWLASHNRRDYSALFGHNDEDKEDLFGGIPPEFMAGAPSFDAWPFGAWPSSPASPFAAAHSRVAASSSNTSGSITGHGTQPSANRPRPIAPSPMRPHPSHLTSAEDLKRRDERNQAATQGQRTQSIAPAGPPNTSGSTTGHGTPPSASQSRPTAPFSKRPDSSQPAAAETPRNDDEVDLRNQAATQTMFQDSQNYKGKGKSPATEEFQAVELTAKTDPVPKNTSQPATVQAKQAEDGTQAQQVVDQNKVADAKKQAGEKEKEVGC